MRRLAGAVELLDGRLDDRAALHGNLRDLRRINRLLGGVRLSAQATRRLLDGVCGDGGDGGDGDGETSLIDVGTGAADIPLALVAESAGWRCRLRVVAVDSRPEVLDAARSLDPRLRATDGSVALRVADGRRLPWPNRTFDVGHASLVLHHLEPAEAVALLRELRRVSRRGVVVNDLARGRAWWAIAWLGSRLLTRNRLTRHDGPLSVRRAYTVKEARRLLQAAGLRPVVVASGLLGHRFAIAAIAMDER